MPPPWGRAATVRAVARFGLVLQELGGARDRVTAVEGLPGHRIPGSGSRHVQVQLSVIGRARRSQAVVAVCRCLVM